MGLFSSAPPHNETSLPLSPGELQCGSLAGLANEAVRPGNACLLMFSGGRDSSLAALRLHKAGARLVLVTVTSEHLIGIDRVWRRLSELSLSLPAETPWIHVRQPTELQTDMSFYEQTCLPCHHGYVVVSGAIAKVIGTHRLAFGYAGYQSAWPEQTTLAVSSLRRILARHGIMLELPVYDLLSRDDALTELATHGLSTESLEQKCLRQVTNIALADERLKQQIGLWEAAIDHSMFIIDSINIEVLSHTMLGNAR